MANNEFLTQPHPLEELMHSPSRLAAMGDLGLLLREREGREERIGGLGLLLKEMGKGDGKKKDGEGEEGKDGGRLHQLPTRSSMLNPPFRISQIL